MRGEDRRGKEVKVRGMAPGDGTGAMDVNFSSSCKLKASWRNEEGFNRGGDSHCWASRGRPGITACRESIEAGRCGVLGFDCIAIVFGN
jgi:hypothetical protein